MIYFKSNKRADVSNSLLFLEILCNFICYFCEYNMVSFIYLLSLKYYNSVVYIQLYLIIGVIMNLKQDVGYKAAEQVKDGQILGLGTGSTTHYFIEKVGMRVKEEEIEVMGIPTSYQSALLAQQWNIPVTSLDEYSIDLAVDGADEIDPNLNLIKGGGAAHTLEKIVDYSADELIIIADDSKYVEVLGGFPVPVEVIPKSKTPVMNALMDIGAKPEVRMGVQKDGPVITDNGNFIIDAKFEEILSPVDMEFELNTIPGIVENGLFTEMVDKVILGSKEGIKELKL